MTEIEKARVSKAQDKLKARIVRLTEQLRVARAKSKGARASSRTGAAARPAASKARPRARARSARSSEAVAS